MSPTSLSVGELLAYLRLDDTGFTRGISVAREQMQGATGSAERMTGAVGMTEKALANAGRQATIASGGTAKFRAAQLSAVAATERYNAVLADENATIRQLATAEAALIRANEAVRASSPARSIAATGAAAEVTASRMAGFRASMASGIATMGKLGLGLGAFELARKAIDIGKEAASFQKNMLLIQTQAHGTAAEVKDLSARVLELAPAVATGPDELATSLYHVYSVGRDANGELIRGARAMQIVKIAAEGAKVGLGDVEDTTNALTATVASGIGGVSSFGQAMGVLNAIVGAGDMHFQDLNEALGSGILARMRVFGVSIQETGAALAVFGDNNIRGANAATMLRMAVQDIAKPAANADKVLHQVGLTTDDLRQSLSEHGLTGALQMLDQSMTAAGITGNKVGAFLEDAFTKRAGGALAILLTQMDRYNAKLHEVTDSGDNFSKQWRATTQNASFAFQKLGVQAETAGIKIANKVIPAATKAAQWLGTNLPHAVSVLSHILGPTVELIGNGLGRAWTVVSSTLRVAASALGSVGHFLEQNKTIVTSVATAVLGMWAAWKLIAGVGMVLRLIGPALTAIGMKANAAATGMRTMSTGALAARGAMLGLGLVIAGVVTYQQEQARQAAATKAAVDAYTAAIEADNEALGKNVRLVAEQSNQTYGADAAARKYGVSQSMLVDAELAQGKAAGTLRAQVLAVARAHGADGDSLFRLGLAMQQNQKNLAAGITQRKEDLAVTRDHTYAMRANKATADEMRVATSRNSEALGNLSANARTATTATKSVSMGMDGDSISAKRLADYIQRLTTNYQKLVNAELAQTQSQLAFKQGLFQLGQQAKDYGTSLSTATAKGVEARSGLVGLLQTAQQGAVASKNYGKTLLDNVRQFQTFAHNAGYSKTAVDNLLRSEHLLPKQIEQRLHLDTSPAQQALIDIQTQINAMHPTIHVGITGGSTTPGHYIPPTGRASGGSLPDGVSSVGEQGAELAIKHGDNVQILSHAQSRAFLARTGMKAPGFAAGTSPTDAAKAARQAALGKAQSAVSGIEVSILAPTPTALHQFLTAVDAATNRLSAAAAAGVSSKKLDALRTQLSKMVHEANKQLGNLRVHINRADMADLTRSLKGTASDVRSAWQSTIADLRAAGLTAGQIARFGHGEQTLVGHVQRRDALQARLAQARQDRQQLSASVTSGVSGFFDVSQSGANPVTGQVTFGGLRAQQLQAKNQILKWASGIKRLARTMGKTKAGKEYLQELASSPSTLPQVEALLSGGAAGLQSVIDTQRVIDKAAASVGGVVSTAVDGAAVDRLSAAVDKQNKIIDKLDKKIAHGIHDGLDGLKFEIDARGIARLVDTGHKKLARH